MADKRVAVISEDLAEPWDEGIKKFTYLLSRALRKEAEVLLLNIDRSRVEGKTALRIPGTKTFLSRALWKRLNDFGPDIILYVPSPSSTIASFLRCAVLRMFQRKSIIAMVALIPRRHPGLWRHFLRALSPDKIYVPSYASLLHLRRLSLPGELIALGVDKDTFKPAIKGERSSLREKLNISNDEFLFLHVGHLSRKRNIAKLSILAGLPGSSVLLVGSTSTPEDMILRDELELKGIKVIREYVQIEDFYQMADCYVFPVEDSEGCVEFPLSVLEALASGLPVLAYPFGGLRDFLPEGKDMVYFSDENEMKEKAMMITQSPRPKARSMESFSWDRVAHNLISKLGVKTH